MYTENDCQRAESVHGNGHEGEDLRRYVAQCIEAERAQKEADRALEREKATIAAENETKKAKIEAETEKAKIEAAKEAEEAKIEAAKIEAEKMTAENERLKIEAARKAATTDNVISTDNVITTDSVKHLSPLV